MIVEETPIKDLLIIKPRIFSDSRGYFFETYNKFAFQQAGISAEFVQDNQSCSKKGTLRGLHYQADPYAQGKLVRVISGSVLDIAVDIRKDSTTYGKHYLIELTAYNQLQFWLPPGMAHGFLALEDDTIFCYKCTNKYNKESEGGIKWDDPELRINWNYDNPLVSEKDASLPYMKDIITPF